METTSRDDLQCSEDRAAYFLVDEDKNTIFNANGRVPVTHIAILVVMKHSPCIHGAIPRLFIAGFYPMTPRQTIFNTNHRLRGYDLPSQNLLTATGEPFRWSNHGTVADWTDPALPHVHWAIEFVRMFQRTAPGASLTESLNGLGLEINWATSQAPKAGRGATSDVLESVFQRSTNFKTRKDEVSKQP